MKNPHDDVPNYYELLGVSKRASTDEIKQAYRKLICQYHPDTGMADSQMAANINQAYQTLKDPKLRAVYDHKLALARSVEGHFFRTVDFFADNADMLAKRLAKNWQQTHRKLKADWQKNFDKKTKPNDTQMTLTLMPWQVALGETVLVKTDRQTLRLRLPSHANHGTVLKIAGAGKTMDGKAGDLYVNLVIKNPSSQHLTDEQKQAFLALKKAFEGFE